MPVIRDGRGQLTVHDMSPPPSNPSGPVERAQVSAARMADFAAERVRAVDRSNGETPSATPAKPKTRALNPTRAAVRAERVARYLDAIRASDSHRDAAERLGVGKHSLEMFVSDLRRRRELPDDVEQLLRQRNPARRGAVTAPKVNGAEPQIEQQGQEAGAPATDAVDLGTTGAAPAEEVATPPGPPSPAPVMAPEYSAPDPTTIEGEDRCSFGTWLGNFVVVACDRATGHDGSHRGRLIRLGFISETFTVVGYAVVPA